MTLVCQPFEVRDWFDAVTTTTTRIESSMVLDPVERAKARDS